MKGKEEFPVGFALFAFVSTVVLSLSQPSPQPRYAMPPFFWATLRCFLMEAEEAETRGAGGVEINHLVWWESEMRGLPFKPGNSLSSLLFPFIQDKWKAIYLPVGLKTLTPDFHQMTACCLFAVVRRHNWYFSIQSNVWVSASRVRVVFPVHQRSGEKAQDFYLRPDA